VALEQSLGAAEEAANRDPRIFPIGHISSAGSGSDTFTAMFAWFASIEELAQFLHDIEPMIYDLGPGEGLEEFQESVAPVLQSIRKEGLTDELLDAFNDAANPDTYVRWWGTFVDLCSSNAEYCRELRVDFRSDNDEDDHQDRPIASDEIDEFIEFLKEYGH